LALILGKSPTSAAVLGFALALSSTAIVIPVLAEAKRLGTTAGRTIFAVLLFQDLMVAPLLFMVAMLGMRGGGLGMAVVSFLVPALTGLSAIVLGGRLVMRPLFRHVAAAGSTEFFMAACLLVVIGTGVLTAESGLSMGLGGIDTLTSRRQEMSSTSQFMLRGCRIAPRLMHGGSKLSMRRTAHQMPLNIERVVDGRMDRNEALSRFG
jgi:predicted Kef-type K+ transport protein